MLFTVFLGGCTDELPPSIKHGEFPFHIKYEVHGKIYDIKDTVICDYTGFDESLGYKTRTWDAKLRDESYFITVLSFQNTPSIFDSKRINKSARVSINFGRAEYYMGDPNAESLVSAKPTIKYYETYDESERVEQNDSTPLTKKQLEKYFGIKVLEWTFSKPIKNTFR